MSDLSLRLTITAIENATKALERIAKQSEETNSRIGKNNEYWLSKDKREQEKHENWKTNLVKREEEKKAKLIERQTKLAEKEAQKRIKLAEREARGKRQALLQTEQDFRTSAQRMALYTTAPATIMATLGMRAYMEMEQRQIKMKMYYGKEAADMEKFAKEYAIQSAFTIQNTTSLLETIALGKEKLGIKSNQEVRELAKSVGDVILAYTGNAEEQSRVMLNVRQMMNMGRLEGTDLKEMAKAGLDINRLARITGVQKSGETWSAKEIIQIFELASKTNEVLTNIVEKSKTFTQAWDSALEINKSFAEGLGKTLDNQFKLTEFTRLYARIMGKIAEKLGENNDNLTKGMASYLTMMALTVAPMLMLIGHWRKVSLLIGESNMKSGVFKDRLLMVGGAMSGLYLATVDWGDLMKQYEEQGFLKTTLGNLDKVIALMMVGGALYKAIQSLYAFWIAKEARLTALAVIRAAATNPAALIAVAGAAAAIGGTYLLAKGLGSESGQEGNERRGSDPLAEMLGSGNKSYASGKNIEMLASLQSQPKVEVVNNINVDKSGNASVNTKTKDKNTYSSPYSAPIMSDFSLGY